MSEVLAKVSVKVVRVFCGNGRVATGMSRNSLIIAERNNYRIEIDDALDFAFGNELGRTEHG